MADIKNPNTLENIQRWLEGQVPREVDTFEAEIDGAKVRLYNDEIQIRDLDDPGKLRSRKVCVRVPTSQDRADAAVMAIHWSEQRAHAALRRMQRPGEQIRLPPVSDRQTAVGLLGDAVFEELALKATLCLCVHDRKAPHPVNYTPSMFDRLVPHASCLALWERIAYYSNYEDPRPGELDEERMWAIIETIGGRGNTGPFAVIDGRAQQRLLVFMASRLLSYPTATSSSALPSTLPQEGSPTSS